MNVPEANTISVAVASSKLPSIQALIANTSERDSVFEKRSFLSPDGDFWRVPLEPFLKLNHLLTDAVEEMRLARGNVGSIGSNAGGFLTQMQGDAEKLEQSLAERLPQPGVFLRHASAPTDWESRLARLLPLFVAARLRNSFAYISFPFLAHYAASVRKSMSDIFFDEFNFFVDAANTSGTRAAYLVTYLMVEACNAAHEVRLDTGSGLDFPHGDARNYMLLRQAFLNGRTEAKGPVFEFVAHMRRERYSGAPPEGLPPPLPIPKFEERVRAEVASRVEKIEEELRQKHNATLTDLEADFDRRNRELEQIYESKRGDLDQRCKSKFKGLESSYSAKMAAVEAKSQEQAQLSAELEKRESDLEARMKATKAFAMVATAILTMVFGAVVILGVVINGS